MKILFQRKRGRGRAQQKRLTAPGKNSTASEHSETVVKIDPEVKVKSPLLPTPLPLLGGPPMQSSMILSSTSSVAPRTSIANVHVLKNLPPFSGLTSLFDSSLSDPVHVPPPESDYSSLEQPVNTLLNSYPSHSHSLISSRPPPLLNSGDLMNRGNPFKDTITPPMPLRKVTPEEIGTRQDPLQQLHVPGYNAGSVHTSSLNPNLVVLSPATANNRSFTRPPSKPLLPTPVSARSPPPTLRGGGRPASRQLKITSFLSPPKKRPDDLVQLEPEFSTSLAMPSVSHAGLSTRPPPLFPPERTADYGGGATFLPPMASRDRHYPVSKLRDDSGVLPLSDQDSVFDRLDSSAKYHQSRLRFNSNPSQRTLELAPPLHDIHDDPFSRLGPSVTSLNALSMSQFGDSYATGGNTQVPSSEIDQRSPHLHTDRLRLPADSVISRHGSDVVVKLEPEYEDDPSFSPRLYQTRPGGLNVTKALNRFAPKRYQITDATQPSTSFALVKQERDVSVIDTQDVPGSSSGERFVDIQQDSVRNVQQISGHSRDLERTVTETRVSIIDNSTEQDAAAGFQVIDDDELDYVESNGIHIPLSRTGLKVVAIDCEMVGCIRRIPHEQLLASRMKGGAMKNGIGATQGNKGGGGGGGLGVLLKTKMKPQVLTNKQRKKMNKEISVAARCSIIAYDGTVVYDKYINPTIGTNYTIINYRTPWSGIRPSHMICATPFFEARREILDILQRCIVIGHNIRSDMKSLEINDIPEWQIRDTSVHPTLKKSAGGSRALKKMAHILLGRDIQMKSRVGHCSVEDATATMDLYKLVELEWEQ